MSISFHVTYLYIYLIFIHYVGRGKGLFVKWFLIIRLIYRNGDRLTSVNFFPAKDVPFDLLIEAIRDLTPLALVRIIHQFFYTKAVQGTSRLYYSGTGARQSTEEGETVSRGRCIFRGVRCVKTQFYFIRGEHFSTGSSHCPLATGLNWRKTVRESLIKSRVVSGSWLHLGVISGFCMQWEIAHTIFLKRTNQILFYFFKAFQSVAWLSYGLLIFLKHLLNNIWSIIPNENHKRSYKIFDKIAQLVKTVII